MNCREVTLLPRLRWICRHLGCICGVCCSFILVRGALGPADPPGPFNENPLPFLAIARPSKSSKMLAGLYSLAEETLSAILDKTVPKLLGV